MDPLSYNPSTGDFVFTPLDETEGGRRKREKAKKYNDAARRVMQIGNSAIGTKNQYMNFKRQILRLDFITYLLKMNEKILIFVNLMKTNISSPLHLSFFPITCTSSCVVDNLKFY